MEGGERVHSLGFVHMVAYSCFYLCQTVDSKASLDSTMLVLLTRSVEFAFVRSGLPLMFDVTFDKSAVLKQQLAEAGGYWTQTWKHAGEQSNHTPFVPHSPTRLELK